MICQTNEILHIIQLDNIDFVTYALSELIIHIRPLYLSIQLYLHFFPLSTLSYNKFNRHFTFFYLLFSLIVDCTCNTSTHHHHHVKVLFVNSTIHCDTSSNSSSVVLLYVLMHLYIYMIN